MGFKRNLAAFLAVTSLTLPNDSIGQGNINSDTVFNNVDSIVVDIPLDNRLGFYIFDDYVNTCWKAKKILAANGMDTTYNCKDSVLAQRNIALAEDLLDDDITRWVVTYTMIGLELMKDSVRNSQDSTLKLEARYHMIYESLLQKYPFFKEVMLRQDPLDEIY